MKTILSILTFVMILSSTSFAGRIEYVTEETCPSPAGCRIIIKTGECIGCITTTRKIVHEDEIVVKKKLKRSSKKSVVRKGKRKWRCVIKPWDWIDENGNLKS